jgi:hypothetical protein
MINWHPAMRPYIARVQFGLQRVARQLRYLGYRFRETRLALGMEKIGQGDA